MGAPQRLTGRVGHRAIVESIKAPKSSGRGANSSGTWIHGPIFFGGDIERTGIVVVDVSTWGGSSQKLSLQSIQGNQRIECYTGIDHPTTT